MRIQIRTGVFETNSSSTHSLQLANGDRDSVIRDVMMEMMEQYAIGAYVDTDDEHYAAWYIDNGTFWIEGLCRGESDENKCVACIVTNMFTKIQFLAGVLADEISDHYMNYICDDDVKSNQLWKKFTELVIDFLNGKGYDVREVKIKENVQRIWMECCEGAFDVNIDEDNIENWFNKVMDDDYVIKETDYAYSPTMAPEFYIY